MDKLWVIGVSGTNGAGKDEVGHILEKHHGYLFISVTELLRAECARRKLPVERQYLRMISAEWRRELGLGVLVDKAIAEFEVNRHKYKGLVVISLRNPGEADRVHDLGGTVIWLDADPKIRYARIQAAMPHRSHRAGEDDKTYEQFLAEEMAEMHAPEGGDSAVLNMAGVKDLSDATINNNSDDIKVFRSQIEKTLGLPKE